MNKVLHETPSQIHDQGSFCASLAEQQTIRGRSGRMFVAVSRAAGPAQHRGFMSTVISSLKLQDFMEFIAMGVDNGASRVAPLKGPSLVVWISL